MNMPTQRPPANAWDLDVRAVRRAFSRAAHSYDATAVLQREVGARMAARLDVVKLAPRLILDAGSGSGAAQAALAARFPQAQRLAFDLALPLLALAGGMAERRSLLARLAGVARNALGTSSAPELVCGDIVHLPFGTGIFDLIWSNLALQWVSDLPAALAEFQRCLSVGGLLSFTTFGPDTLRELRAAFSDLDGYPHVSRFADMHDIGDLLVHAGFADPVMDMEYLTLTYAEPQAMMRELKALGATNATAGRGRGLMGRNRWERVCTALAAMRKDGRIPATFEVVYGHAWKAAPTRTADGRAIVRFQAYERRQ